MGNKSIQSNFIDIAPFIHQAALSPHSSVDAIKQICEMSKQLGFSGLCTNLNHLQIARERLGKPNNTKLIAVIAFPFGFTPGSIKQQEAEWAAEKGAEELDVVPNFFALNAGKEELFAEELSRICELGLPVRAIIDLPNLTSEKVALAIEASIEAGVSGIQSGNGFGTPATNFQIQKISGLTKKRCAIKAVGGIKTINHALEIIEVGATYIGTSFGKELIESIKTTRK